jgi:hypothetical protein
MLRRRTEGEQERFYCSYAPHYPVRVASGPALFSQLSAGLRLRRHVERLMRPHLFRDRHELLEYAEEHDLLYAWEGMRLILAPARHTRAGTIRDSGSSDQARHYSRFDIPEGYLAGSRHHERHTGSAHA